MVFYTLEGLIKVNIVLTVDFEQIFFRRGHLVTVDQILLKVRAGGNRATPNALIFSYFCTP